MNSDYETELNNWEPAVGVILQNQILEMKPMQAAFLHWYIVMKTCYTSSQHFRLLSLHAAPRSLRSAYSTSLVVVVCSLESTSIQSLRENGHHYFARRWNHDLIQIDLDDRVR